MKKIITITVCLTVLTVIAMTVLQNKNVGFSMNDGNITASANSVQSSDPEEVIANRLGNAIVLFAGSPKAYVNNQHKQIDEIDPEVSPIVKDNRTLVPVRFIAESLGAKVGWNEKTSEINISLEKKNIQMILGSKTIKVNNKPETLEVSAQTINGRTLVPLRALAEAFEKKVFYDRGLIVISNEENLFDASTDKALLDQVIARVNILPTVGSYEKLVSLIEETRNYSRTRYKIMGVAETAALDAANAAPAAKSEQAPISNAKSKSADYSTTNVQVQGVDEADMVKTDGEYIYQVNKQRIVIAKAYPSDKLEIVDTITFDDKEFNPFELYLDKKHLVIIGSTYRRASTVTSPVEAKKMAVYNPDKSDTVKAIVFDITDKNNIKNIREVVLDGRYATSRKIGDALYLITNKYFDYYYLKEQPQEAVPQYLDSAVSQECVSVDYKDIQYIPNFENPNYLMIAGINLSRPEEQMKVSTYLGTSENVYVSDNNMYIAVIGYNAEKNDAIQPDVYSPVYNQLNTLIYKFSLNEGRITYLNKGDVPGTILNQFSMDESDGYFRIATTKGDMWRNDEYTSKNNVYILDDTLNITGRLEDIAPGERIYSVRFMGDKAYMVTFKKVDPLFVIDLKNPMKPSILGALKIPGYSDYLHPYDENHIIGFGKDTVEITQKDYNGNVVSTGAFYQGMKMALFDVSDVSSPKEKFTEYIGDRGTDSELLKNHKALLFSKEKELLAFPVTLMEVKDKNNTKNGFPQHGEFTFQGAYVYHLDLVNGFKLKGTITHLTDEDYHKSGSYWYDNERNIERILYIDDTLYTLSKKNIKAHSLDDLKEKNIITIP